MDHEHNHNGNGDGEAGASCPMIMTFHAGHCEHILWRGWMASTVTEFVVSALAIFLVAVLYESLKFVREYFLRKTVRREAERMAVEIKSRTSHCASTGAGSGSGGGGGCSNTPLAELREKTYLERITSSPHLVQTLFNLVQIVISYLLMLVFMTFNYWLCLSVILGLGVGYFFFGWIKQDVYENECCH